ncbi:hypothetical protein WG68_07965 [Arsukibacterium ikkense]|uniref:Protein kinase domain-containing protein n=1 Tax=Arsukibacterium ikkense TaxID=336831 RepID=A0A0M2V9U1_9GAMM|nr:class III lanthionine synthetase LanKC [Arsukibacterium ikkense]KKO45933.1 hypothetical protein WG68_07965 [Arsukibacterium ikkense]
MMDNLYTFADPEFFLPPSTMEASEKITNAIKQILPADWRLQHYNIWLAGSPTHYDIPEQGFKIHISAIRDQALEIIEKVVSQCVRFQCSFKIICRQDIADHMTSKSVNRSSAGKFITIYPINDNVFKQLIHAIYLITRQYQGPYILSDRRYLDSKIVHYRYGGFKIIPRLLANGSTEACIKTPGGELIKDERTPYYQIPSWVEEPFPDQTSQSATVPLLNNRYRVLEALSFSNSGGVYKAEDTLSGRQVVIKEARPFIHFTALNKKVIYADNVLSREFSIIKKLSGNRYFPAAIDWFKEWEHHYLVEEFIEGEPLRTFRAQSENTLAPFTANPHSAERFKRQFCWLAKECILAVMAAHQRGVTLADISPNNIMVDAAKETIRFIDFEGAFITSETDKTQDVAVLTTPGFSETKKLLSKGASYQGDWYALAMVLYSTVLPVQQFFELAPDLRWALLEQITADCLLAPEIAAIIKQLAKAKPRLALGTVSNLNHSYRPAQANLQAEQLVTLPQVIHTDHHALFKHTLAGCAQFITHGCPLGHDSHFIPVDFQAYDTHPLALAYGYYGPALLCHSVTASLPQHLQSTLNRHKCQPAVPGIFVGSAGMALAELALGRIEQAELFAEQSFQSALVTDANNFGYGIAGVGFMALAMFQQTNKISYLQQAIKLAQVIRKRVLVTDDGIRFIADSETKNYVGFAQGNAGIALFLLQLAKLSNNNDWLKLAEQAIKTELVYGLNSTGQYQWGDTAGSKLILPYWQFGANGIGAVVIRFYQETGKAEYLTAARAIAAASYSRYAAQQSSFDGMAGIADFYIDMYQTTAEQHYLTHAEDIASKICLFAVKRKQGLVFPGQKLIRLSTDFAHGSAGICLMLKRLLSPGPRFMLDLTFRTTKEEASDDNK